MILKNTEEHVTNPEFNSGIVTNILSAQLPIFDLGRFTHFIYNTNLVRFLDETLRMDAIPGVAIVSGLTYKYLLSQFRLRPRIKLVIVTKLILIILLVLTTIGVNKLEAKKPDIKVNGQAVLVAENLEPNDEEAQFDAEVFYKESPLDFIMPVDGYISQSYRGYHRAIDIATGRLGVPIRSLGKGKVEFAGYMADGKGNVVIVNHGDNLKSLYAHLGKIMVNSGDNVDSRIAIGTVGLTGRTTGAHVHLEIYDNDIAVDPEKVLPEMNNPLGLAPKIGVDKHEG